MVNYMCIYKDAQSSITCRTTDVSPSRTTWTSWKQPNGNSNSTQPGPKPENTLKYWIGATLKNPAATPPCRSVSQTSYRSLMNGATGMVKLDTIKILSSWCIIVYTEQYNKITLKKLQHTRNLSTAALPPGQLCYRQQHDHPAKCVIDSSMTTPPTVFIAQQDSSTNFSLRFHSARINSAQGFEMLLISHFLKIV